MKIEIEIPKFHSHRVHDILNLIKEIMDSLGISQYKIDIKELNK